MSSWGEELPLEHGASPPTRAQPAELPEACLNDGKELLVLVG